MRQQQEQPVTISSEAISLSGFLGIPSKPKGVVLFAHGSGSGRFSPRNRFVAQHLQQGAIATLLIDLLMREEEEDRRNVFDIELLADRVLMASAWLRANARTGQLALGYFGASTGAGAALQAAARAPFRIGAIVSRGGRPDLAERDLPAPPLSEATGDYPGCDTSVRRTGNIGRSGGAGPAMVSRAFRSRRLIAPLSTVRLAKACSNDVADLVRGLLRRNFGGVNSQIRLRRRLIGRLQAGNGRGFAAHPFLIGAFAIPFHADRDGAFDSHLDEARDHAACQIAVGLPARGRIEHDGDAVCNKALPGEGQGPIEEIAFLRRVGRLRGQQPPDFVRFQDVHGQSKSLKLRPQGQDNRALP
jgi:putative phosphoribosyl transferase